MTDALTHPKITPHHLARQAIVYLRQSSGRQVRENLESQRLQYGLVDRARALGWQQVQTLDADLGCSASVGAARRDGFERLIASVALGAVGIILSREASRLSRTDKDWCHLLELCQIFDTLIGDEQQVYDLSVLDDQLVLGIKGTLSVVELKVLNLRLVQGQEAKARRGELAKQLPAGYVRDALGQVVKDPDRRVQEAIELVFRKFRQTWSIRQTFMWFHASAIELPVSKSEGGGTGVVWQLPTQPFVGNLLRNPFYAGAYVYGRRPKQTVFLDGRLRKRTSRLRRPEECRVFIRDHHEGYIDWATYEEHQRMIRRNGLQLERDESVAAVRAGQGLLVGLLRCGRCGRKLQVRYRGKRGTAGRYACKGDFDAGGRYCLAFGGGTVDRRFSEQILEAISPWGLQASLEAIEGLSAGEAEKRQALARQLQQLEYEAQRAFEQYDEADPRHRLVAAELERRWNAKLQEVEQTRAALAESEREVRRISAAERETILALGDCFPAVWHSADCRIETKKQIVRTVVEEVVVNLDEASQTLRFVIHWKGGTHTQFEMDKPRSGAGRKTSMEALEIIQRMADRFGDDRIAAVLNRLGHRTGQDKRWNEHRVATARRNHAIAGHKRTPEDPDIVSLGQAAKYCGVSQTAIKRLMASGLLHVAQVVPYAPWEIRRPDLDSEPVRSIIERLRRTGKLVLQGGCSGSQSMLFAANTEA
jgi:DNA invertase Pin-like site-specific DNA recombinase